MTILRAVFNYYKLTEKYNVNELNLIIDMIDFSSQYMYSVCPSFCSLRESRPISFLPHTQNSSSRPFESFYKYREMSFLNFCLLKIVNQEDLSLTVPPLPFKTQLKAF